MQISIRKWSRAGQWIVEKRERVPGDGGGGEDEGADDEVRKARKKRGPAASRHLPANALRRISSRRFRFLLTDVEHSQRDSLSEILAT